MIESELTARELLLRIITDKHSDIRKSLYEDACRLLKLDPMKAWRLKG